ncbi:MAG: OmpA family protein [Myxococcales bacterium]
MRCVAASTAAPVTMAEAQAKDSAAPADSCSFPTVRFDFNSADLSSAAEHALQQAVTCLQTQPVAHIRIEGFCDERGTEEYNLALGQRRASKVEKYLENLGIHRIGTISYGKDKPVCSEESEECWKRNRRADFEVSR